MGDFMKYIDKVKEMYPELTGDEIYNDYCPYYYNLEVKPNSCRCIFMGCKRCWNREMR
jgi:hypothetical protein